MSENVNVEYKELDRITGKLPDTLPKEIVSFANTEGGEIHIGIRDDGTVVGVQDSDDVMTRISNVAHDSVLPDIMPFIQIRSYTVNEKEVVRITVSTGTERPYYLASKGLKPSGVYVRRGSACVPLSESGIRQMILDTSGKSYEECRSMNQDLTFDTLRSVLTARGLESGPEQLKTLKLIGGDGLYTNLALLLSDQCAHTIKVAAFQGRDNAVFRDRKEFSGSLLKQLEDTYALLTMYNKTEATFDGLHRTDRHDYPDEALREALLNSIIHRDYLFSGSTLINLFDDHVEFISLGGLISGLSMEAVFMGASQSRNPNLAAVFYRLGLVESYGTGIRKILRLYNGCRPLPVFRSAEGAFTVEMRNRNEIQSFPPAEASGKTPTFRETAAASAREKILALISEKGEVSRKEIEGVLQVGSTKAYKCLKQLCEEGLILQNSNGNRTTYTNRIASTLPLPSPAHAEHR